MYGGSNSDGGVFVYGNNKLFLSTNSVRRLTVDGVGNVGINTTTDAGFRLDVNGTARVQGNLTTNLTAGSVPFIGASGLLSQDNTNLFWDNTFKVLTVTRPTIGNIFRAVSGTVNGQLLEFSSTATGVRIASGFATGITGTFEIFAGGGNSTLSLGTNSTERVRIFSSGNTFIGPSASDAGYRLNVNGTARVQGNLNVSTGGITLTGAQTIQTSTGNLTLATDADNGNIHLVPNGSGIVDIRNFNGTTNTQVPTLRFTDLDTSSGTNQKTGRIEFFTLDTTPGPAGVTSFIESITEGTSGLGSLIFGTGQSGSATENARFTSNGNFLIGTTTNAGFRLDVNGTARTTGDISVNGVNIGRGGGNISTNTRVGSGALDANTTGANNTANGRNALQNNTTGSGNTANGLDTLINNTTGTGNTSNGFQVLLSNTTGDSNTAIGREALRSNITGSNNSAIGRNSGRFIADGATANTISNNSIFIGVDTRAAADNQTNQIVIGHQAIGLGSNTTVLGNTSTTHGRWYGSLLLGTTTNAASSILTMESTTQGVLFPRMTTTQKNAIASPATGLVVYDNTLNKLSVFTGVTWETVTSL
jgi:hypothetical protein